MLSLTLTYHDTLYLATELGALALVLALGWLFPLAPHHPKAPGRRLDRHRDPEDTPCTAKF